jgi:hypothetical protein
MNKKHFVKNVEKIKEKPIVLHAPNIFVKNVGLMDTKKEKKNITLKRV